MVFGLGLRHGLDLDHLATIDSITRALKENNCLAKRVGFLFSFGHGLVIILLSLVISSGFIQTQSYAIWLDVLGSWISIVFLFIFGFLTLWKSLFSTSQPGLPAGLKSTFLKKRLGKQYSPLLIMLIGALFAISFDTFTQVALFSISVSIMAGWLFSILLGIVFMLGMMTSDGLNGFFIASLIQRADKRSLFISRVFGLLISCFSLTLGMLGLIKQL